MRIPMSLAFNKIILFTDTLAVIRNDMLIVMLTITQGWD